jgi:microcystin-dependent protein
VSSPFVGEIRLVGFAFAPVGWAFCDGSLLLISEYETLFNLIGTTYGGDGQNTFALPDLRSRIPVHVTGGSYVIGQTGGVESVTLTQAQIPAHGHVPLASSSSAASTAPGGNVWAADADSPYSSGAPTAAMDPGAVQAAGGSQPHDNMAPFLVVNFIISLFGTFPSQA